VADGSSETMRIGAIRGLYHNEWQRAISNYL
jgi:hypothetical protein